MHISLRPTGDVFFQFFGEAADNLVKGAHALTKLTDPDADRRWIAKRLVEIEHANDVVTHEMISKLNSTFVTPFDREDIYRLGSALDDVVDHMEAAATLVNLYAAPEIVPEMSATIHVIVECADTTAAAMPKLKPRKDLHEYWIEVNRLENDADRHYRHTLARLFSGEYAALTVLKLKDIADELETP